MHNPQDFDYNQPSRDALAGICVEVSDGPAEVPSSTGQEGPVVVAQLERLFGLTLTVDDENTAERPNRTPRAG